MNRFRMAVLALFVVAALKLEAQRVELLKDTLVLDKNLRYVPISSQLKPGKINVFFFTNEDCDACMDQTNILETEFIKKAVPSNMSIHIMFTGKLKDPSSITSFSDLSIPYGTVYIDTNQVYSKIVNLRVNPVVFFVNEKGRILYTYNETKIITGNKIREVADGLFTGRIKPEQLSFDAQWIPCNRDTATYYREYNWNNITGRYILTDYYKNGKPQMKGQYSRLNPLMAEGEFSFFRNDGSIESKRSYKKDQLEGFWINYDSSGIAYEWLPYKNDVLNGSYRMLYTDSVYLDGQLREGVRTGTWRAFYPNGKPYSVSNWKEGKMNGIFKCWDETGELFIKVNTKDGEVVYDTIPMILYDNGQPFVDVYGISADKSTATLKYYKDDGSMYLQRTVTGKDRVRATYYEADGTLKAQYELDMNKKALDGPFMIWHKDGKKKYEILFANNIVLTGSKIWYENGRIKEYYDPADKKIKYYDEEGNLISNPTSGEMHSMIDNGEWGKKRYTTIAEGVNKIFATINAKVL